MLCCKYCKKEFSSNLEQIAHHKSDWHRTNLKLLQDGKALLSLDEYIDTLPIAADLKDIDRRYWFIYYLTYKFDRPSSFAQYVYDKYISNKINTRVLDVGCGNLRDANFFLNKQCLVTGIELAASMPQPQQGITVIQEDFFLAVNKIQELQDIVYMRFFLHSIPYDKGAEAIRLSQLLLKSGGLLCIEVRSTDKSNIQDEYLKDHSRWLYTVKQLKELLSSFEILELTESVDYSPRPTENPVLIRAIARKTQLDTFEQSPNYPLYKATVEKNKDYLQTSYSDLTKFNKFIEDNNITYTAVGGSVLGLQRHGGIIPWDADIDIGLTEENFTKLMALKHGFRIRPHTKNKHCHLGTLDIFLLEDKGDWYEGENETYCHKTEYATIKKQTYGKTHIYAPANSLLTMERKYGKDYNIFGLVKGKEPFRLVNGDRNYL
jgi:SAM-dependent methyltransferase